MFSSELPGRGLHSPRPVSRSRPNVVISQCKMRGTRRGGLVVGGLVTKRGAAHIKAAQGT